MCLQIALIGDMDRLFFQHTDDENDLMEILRIYFHEDHHVKNSVDGL